MIRFGTLVRAARQSCHQVSRRSHQFERTLSSTRTNSIYHAKPSQEQCNDSTFFSNVGVGFGVAFTALALIGGPNTEVHAASDPNVKQDYTDIDRIYDTGDHILTMSKLNKVPEDKKDFEWYWRKARTTFNIATSDEISKQNPTKKTQMVNEAYDDIQRAKKENDQDHNVLRWYGILLNEYSAQISTTEKIKNLPKVKQLWITAVKLSGDKDTTALHLLGRWEKGLVEIGWVSRQLAKTLFGTLPDASYINAYNYFKKAEDLKPNNWLNNRLKLAEVCIALNRKEEAKDQLQKAMKMEIKTDEDKSSKKEVEKLMKYHGWN